MNMYSIGDMAQIFLSRRQNMLLKNQINDLTTALSTGVVADKTSHLGGNYGYLTDIEHDLEVLKGYKVAANEASTMTEIMQGALEQIQDSMEGVQQSAVMVTSTTNIAAITTTSIAAIDSLNQIVSSLNTFSGGRALFSGTDVGTTPLVSADDILTNALAAVGGATTVADIDAALETYFMGAGFNTDIYQGGTDFLSPIQLGEGESVDLTLKADDVALRAVMKATVMTALATDPALGLSVAEQGELVQLGGAQLFSAHSELTGVRAKLGFTEARVEESLTRIATESLGLEYAKSELIAADPFEIAARLENAQFQLEALYTVTARTASLNLMNYL